MTKMQKAARTVLFDCMNLKKDEELLILTDEPLLEIANVIFRTANKRLSNVHLLQMSQHFIRKGISHSIARLMRDMNALIALTSHSISHTEARRNACRNGVRIASMPSITEHTFARIADTDFVKLARLSAKLKDILTIAKEIKITAPNGTDLTIPVALSCGYADTGFIKEPGAFSNLPAGEASISPDEGMAKGVLIVDSGMGVIPEDNERLSITVKQGRASRISGGTAATRLRRRLAPFGPDSRIVAELGIGTNDTAKLSGYSLEDEKVLGTIHIALGNNVSFGGNNNVAIHLDGVVYNATAIIDGRKILDKGRLLLD